MKTGQTFKYFRGLKKGRGAMPGIENNTL